MADSKIVEPGASTVFKASPEFENATYRKVTLRLLPFCMICYIVAYLDRVNVGFAKLQMLGDLHFSETVYGLGAGMFSLATSFLKSQATWPCTRWARASGSPAS